MYGVHPSVLVCEWGSIAERVCGAAQWQPRCACLRIFWITSVSAVVVHCWISASLLADCSAVTRTLLELLSASLSLSLLTRSCGHYECSSIVGGGHVSGPAALFSHARRSVVYAGKAETVIAQQIVVVMVTGCNNCGWLYRRTLESCIYKALIAVFFRTIDWQLYASMSVCFAVDCNHN